MGTWKKWFKYITPDDISVYALGEGGGVMMHKTSFLQYRWNQSDILLYILLVSKCATQVPNSTSGSTHNKCSFWYYWYYRQTVTTVWPSESDTHNNLQKKYQIPKYTSTQGFKIKCLKGTRHLKTSFMQQAEETKSKTKNEWFCFEMLPGF